MSGSRFVYVMLLCRNIESDNDNRDGTIKTLAAGHRRVSVFTQGYLRLRARLKELHRRLAAYRRTARWLTGSWP